MKYIITLLLCTTFVHINLFGQSNGIQGKLDQLEQKLLDQRSLHNEKIDSISHLFNDTISIIKVELNEGYKTLAEKEESLLKNLDDSSNLIEYLNSIVSTYEVLFAILGIFIALVTLILPFATYQYAVKPSKEAIKDLEKDFDSKLSSYLENLRNKQIDDALDKINNENPEERSRAVSFLTYIQNEGLNDVQMFKIYQLIKHDNYDNSVKGQLAFILATRKTDFADELFNSDLIINDVAIRQMAQLYFAKTDFRKNMTGIKLMLSDEETQMVSFNTLLIYLNQHSSNDINDFINTSEIIDLLTDDTLRSLKVSMQSIINSLNNTDVQFESSVLDEKIKNVPEKPKKN